MNKYIVRCEDCEECKKINGIYCCHEMWDAPCEKVDDCPFGIELEEVKEINEKAAAVRIDHGTESKERAKRKPRTIVTSDEKKQLFQDIFSNLAEIYGENAEISKENKLIIVKIADRTFKIDLIEQRKPKH